jgi:hypothetical protein
MDGVFAAQRRNETRDFEARKAVAVIIYRNVKS